MKKKKQLLAESEIRQFMKFANIGSLANPFVERMNETYEMGLTEQEEEEDLEAEDPMADPMADAGVEDLEAAPEDAGMDDMDVEAEPAAGGDVDAALQGVMDAVEAMKLGFREKGMDAVADAIGLSATGDEEMGDEEMGDEDLDMDLDAAEGDDEMGDEDLGGEEEIEALAEADIYLEDEEKEKDESEMVNEVARRVARRLLQARRSR